VEVDGQTIPYVVSRGDSMGTGRRRPRRDTEAREPEGTAEREIPAENEIPAEQETGEPEPETTDLGTAEAVPEEEPRRRRPRERSLMTFFSFDCPGDNRARLGVWFAPDPAPGKPNAEVDLTGTIGDPEKIREFVRHFAPCG
jgi:hypothetical protein